MDYVKPKDASKYYNVSENTLRSWSSQGKIKLNNYNTYSRYNSSLNFVIIFPRILRPVFSLYPQKTLFE